MEKKLISLSPSKLAILNECSRCFWLKMNSGVSRPRGPFPSLPGGIDRKLKPYFDAYREDGKMPPEFEGKLPGRLFPNKRILRGWRNWRTGLVYENKELMVELIGALDDCLVIPNLKDLKKQFYVPFDYKTKGGVPKTNGAEYYQTQLDCYDLMLDANDYPTCGKGILAYVYPNDIERTEDLMRTVVPFDFGIAVYELPCSKDRAKALLARACEILRGPIPGPGLTCEFCKYVGEYDKALQTIKKAGKEAK